MFANHLALDNKTGYTKVSNVVPKPTHCKKFFDKIGDHAFAGSKIQRVYLSCSSIGYKAFERCDDLRSIGMADAAAEAPVINDSFDDAAYENCTIYCEETEIDAYRQTPGWNRIKNYRGEIPWFGLNNDTEIAKRLTIDGNSLQINTGENVSVEVLTVSGVCTSRFGTSGQYSFTLPHGFHIVRITTASGEISTTKIAVR